MGKKSQVGSGARIFIRAAGTPHHEKKLPATMIAVLVLLISPIVSGPLLGPEQ